MPADELELVPKGIQGTYDAPAHDEESFDKGKVTHMICLTALAVSWAVGIACVVIAATEKPKQSVPADANDDYENDWAAHSWKPVFASRYAAELSPLALNAVMTALLDGLGLIHATTLRWSLGDKLTFNANLRLFTSSRKHAALSWPINVAFALLLILCYTSTSLFFANQPSDAFCKLHAGGLGKDEHPRCGDEVYLATPAVYTLGVGVLGQAALATWQYVSVNVPTWSSNPLDTAWARATIGLRRRVPDRCMMSVHDSSLPATPQPAKPGQRSIWTARHKEVRWIMRYIWISLGFAILFFISIEAAIEANVARIKRQGVPCNSCGTYVGANWNIVPDANGIPTSTAIITEQSNASYAGLFLLLFVVTGVVTMALHCAELITVLHRDEVTWRRCASKKVYSARQNAVVRAANSRSAALLFLLKVTLHWVSGKGVGYLFNWGIFLRPPQLLYLSIGMAVLSGFATFLCFKSPKGPQPATFGHVQTLVDLIDDWSLLMFWGDKGLSTEDEDVRHAGTAGYALDPVVVGALYAR